VATGTLPPTMSATVVARAARSRPAVSTGWLARAALALARRPGLWLTALTQLLRLAPRGWWRRRPFLPLPDPAYLRFRLQTQYGDDRPAEPGDVITYLHWCRAWPHARG